MAQPRPLSHPPIVEALVDLRTSVPGDPELFTALANELKDEFPTKQQWRNSRGEDRDQRRSARAPPRGWVLRPLEVFV